MSRFLLAATGVVALVSLSAQQPPRGVRQVAHSVKIAAERHDRSPALRDIVPLQPGATHRPSTREKRLDRAVRRLGTALDPIVQNYTSAALMGPAMMSADGLGNMNNVLPPDTNSDVGPNHFVQSVNVSFAVYSKGNATSPPALIYGPAAINTLFTGFGGPCEVRNDGDPIVMYDHLADRWVVSQLALPNLVFGFVVGPFYQCIAVSATPDPTGAYHRYQFRFDKLNDYPKLGVWPDAYYMAINQFTAVSLQFAGQGVIAFERDKMLAGLPATMQYVDLGPVDINLGGMLPADLDGPAPPAGSPAYFVQVDDDAWGLAAQDQLQLWRFHVDWTNPANTTFTGPSVLPVAPFDSDMCSFARQCIPQPATAARVDAMADRLMYRLQYRNFGGYEAMVVNHTVDADSTDHAGVRWYEIRDPATSPYVYQQGTYAPDADHRWMASVAMDATGNIALGFSVSGNALPPSVRYTGRLAGDPLGVMTQGENELVTGGGVQTHESGRWGDYSMMAVDPIDGCTFWYTQEYYAATSYMGWQTRVASFLLPGCASGDSSPRVTVAASTPTANESGVSGGFTLSRTGPTDAPLTVTYVISGTATAGVDYAAVPPLVTIPPGAASVVVPISPIDDPVSEPNESVSLMVVDQPAYTPGSPSQAVVTVVSDDQPADMLVTVITGPAAAMPGETIVVNETTKNNGLGGAIPSATGFYLSANILIDASDTFLGVRDIPLLAAGASDGGTFSFTLPPTTAIGSYYVIAAADKNGVVAETNENNNRKYTAPIKVGPDMVISSFIIPPRGGSGATISVTDTTKNQGSLAAGPSRTSFYFSTNALLDASDPLIGSRTIDGVAAGATDTATTPVQIPGGLGTGTYFLFAKSDANSQVVETTENNNATSATAIKLGPDLTSSGVTAPSSAASGATVSLTETVNNVGGGDASPFTIRFYLSTNLAFDPAVDVLIGSRDVQGVAANSSHTATTPITIPPGTAARSYYIVVVVDAAGAVTETSETNNTAARLIRITVGT